MANLAKMHAIRPMLLHKLETATTPVLDHEFAYEAKYDGYRMLLHHDADGIRLITRHGADFTEVFPEIQALADVLPVGTVLDGEIVCFGADGKPSGKCLEKRGTLRRAARVAIAMKRTPVHFVAFDVLYAGGTKVMDRDYLTRRSVLEGLHIDGANWKTATYSIGRGAELFAAACAMGLEGIVAKRLSATYAPGTRSPNWLKIKNPAYVRS
jgi:bifunctional non-homologous end joining protein LigD